MTELEMLKFAKSCSDEVVKQAEVIKEKDRQIESLKAKISLLKDEERMRLKMTAQSDEIARLHERIRNVSGYVVTAAKMLVNVYTEDLSKVELPESE
jgi:hypothetical protein